MTHRWGSFGAAAASVLVAMVMLSGCVAEPDAGPTARSSGTPRPVATESARTASPTPTPTARPIALPTDCRAILSEAVLAELGETPLNDPAMGIATGSQPDGSLVCLWRDPRADISGLQTTISKMSRGPALDMLNQLADEDGFTCYTPEGGTRCEKTWENEQYPVTQGRTLFWREGVLIDTNYANLAPAGYTDSIIASVFG
ncbi:hypothetical protein ASD65_15260 [Microbacterium sp. Root61]|uniref:hypothetical protein n=1 Tax=Microbacterium sp. Root61 TaxID=1736570 RepID=UPI0007022B8E|nr:hypothetical protein [Microbacterium sp. Root61]KRA25622.1 hypothetical protein ASD65_15260 [Microbacterium sp. Root61]